jgi:hypothetical protein
MKTRTSLGWVLGMALAGVAVTSGFAEDGLNPSQTAISPQAAPRSSTAAAAVTGNAAVKASSPIRYVSPWSYEIEKLTKAGVDEGVVMSYIRNSAGTFSLTADQLISLKNLGVSTYVINAMIEHDRELISGERPLTASAPPPWPESVQAALTASLHTTAPASAEPATVATPLPAPDRSIIAPDDDSEGPGMWVSVEPDDVPDQPASAGPVRVPYPVKLNDPIIILRLPSFALPCW